MRLAGECSAEHIFISEDISGYARARMGRLRLACEDEGLELRAFEGVTTSRPANFTRRAATTTASSPRSGGPGARRTNAIRLRLRESWLAGASADGRLLKLSDLTAELPVTGLPAGGESPAGTAWAAGFETGRGGT